MTSQGAGTLTAGRGNAEHGREGRISGYVLKVIRESTGMTQERFAELLGLDVTTVQGWESGRRPLMAISTGTYLSLRHWLLRLGVPSRLLFQLDMALEADRFVGHVLGTEPGKVRTEDHPLASWVITRPFTDLVAWPFTRTAPSAMAGTARGTGRRGPVATSPSLLPDERAHFFEHLKVVAERADTGRADGMLLRRQAHYVAGFDDTAETADWLTAMQRAEERRMSRAGGWTPSWAVVRSGAHSLARLGDREGLQHFIRVHLADEVCEVANLNYWAYWLGEVGEPQLADTFMIELRPDVWRGTELLRHLTGKLNSANPYLDVVAHTLWALVMLRPSTLDSQTMDALGNAAVRTLDEAIASAQSQRELEAVIYALRMIHRG
ncbi:helix-turn-helix domain-containing protein [Nonomuraea sp. NPDC005692]|uniref:helix-turn-helix domain-containing protein n=1 Tax=Nonomuraea sp. NPDC005692 TaxID=3157168 RepID=UPI0033CB0F13